jgi:hypothetical protein
MARDRLFAVSWLLAGVEPEHRRERRRILADDSPLELTELRAGIEPELVAEQASEVLVGGQRPRVPPRTAVLALWYVFKNRSIVISLRPLRRFS